VGDFLQHRRVRPTGHAEPFERVGHLWYGEQCRQQVLLPDLSCVLVNSTLPRVGNDRARC